MPILFQQIGLGQVQLEWMFLEDFGDSPVVGLQLQLEFMQLQVQLSQVSVDKSVTLLGIQNFLVGFLDNLKCAIVKLILFEFINLSHFRLNLYLLSGKTYLAT